MKRLILLAVAIVAICLCVGGCIYKSTIIQSEPHDSDNSRIIATPTIETAVEAANVDTTGEDVKEIAEAVSNATSGAGAVMAVTNAAAAAATGNAGGN